MSTLVLIMSILSLMLCFEMLVVSSVTLILPILLVTVPSRTLILWLDQAGSVLSVSSVLAEREQCRAGHRRNMAERNLEWRAMTS